MPTTGRWVDGYAEEAYDFAERMEERQYEAQQKIAERVAHPTIQTKSLVDEGGTNWLSAEEEQPQRRMVDHSTATATRNQAGRAPSCCW